MLRDELFGRGGFSVKHNNSSQSEMLSEAKAAKVLGVSRTTLFRLRNSGAIRFYRIGYRVLYSAAQIQEYCSKVEQNTTPKNPSQSMAA